MSNLLLITDMARLNKIFERLIEDNNFTLRLANNLEQGGEEIVIEKPDVVFVQTHLSGLSADILLKHLKKQLGRRRTRFVLLANPGQVSKEILKPYQGWIDLSSEDSELLTAIRHLLTSLLSKSKIPVSQPQPEIIKIQADDSTGAATISETSTLLDIRTSNTGIPETFGRDASPTSAPPKAEATLEDQGIIYSPRPRLSVYSEFNSSFDNAVKKTPEPESIEMASPALEYKWNNEKINAMETVLPGSKRSSFLLWLAPVVILVIVVTFLQKNRSVSKPVNVGTPPEAPSPIKANTGDQPAKVAGQLAEAPKDSAPAKSDQDSRMTDKALITAIAENRGPKAVVPSATSGSRLSGLPDFIPRYGLDKQYGTGNPGWERYKGQVTEFKILREASTIKAIQVIDRGGQGVPESFMKGVLRQVTKNPVFIAESSEKKEGYEIQRGQISDSIKVVYYRDEQEGKLRAFVMTWK